MAAPANVPSIDEIRRKTHDSLGITPCLWQCEISQAVLRGDKDIISVAGTGSGKTLTFWMPLLFRPQGIQIVVTPLNILGKQQVNQLAKAGIKAIPLSGETATHEKYKAIEDGRYRAVVISPEEMLKKDGGFMKLLANDAWASQIISVIWDEGHCIGPSSWGSFRPAYKDAARLRHLLPRHIPYYITSATLDDRAVSEIISTLQLRRERLVQFRYSNDRPNIHLTVRKMAHSMRSYRDLAFLIPNDWKEGDKIPKFLVFFDSIADSVAAARALRRILPAHLRCQIKWFNSDMSSQFRDKTQGQYKEGGVWGLYCTDSFGMGVDLPDIELVVQWRATCDMRTLWQRFGRAARNPSKTAKALLLAEPKWFDADRTRRKAAAEKRETTRLAKRKAKGGAVDQRAKKRRAVGAMSTTGEGVRSAEAVNVGEDELDGASDDSDSDSDDEVEGERSKDGVPAVEAREEANRQEQYDRLRDVYSESRRAEEHSNRVQTKMTKKPKELTAEMDNLINASSRPHHCFRVPIMAFFEQDKAASSHRRCRPDLPEGCPRCHVVSSRICCELCAPHAFTSFAHVDAAANAKAPHGPRSRIESTYKMTEKEKTLSLELHAFRKRRTVEQIGLAQLKDMGPSAFMPNVILKRIVDCARVQKIETIEQLLKETQWKASDADHHAVVKIVAKFFPPAQLMTTTPLVRAPLVQQRARPNNTEPGRRSGAAPTPAGLNGGEVGQGSGSARTSTAPTTGRRCGRCKLIGHISTNAQRCALHPRYDPRPRRGPRNENDALAPAAPAIPDDHCSRAVENSDRRSPSPAARSPTPGSSGLPPPPSLESPRSPSMVALPCSPVPARPRPRPRPVPRPTHPRPASPGGLSRSPARASRSPARADMPPFSTRQRSSSPVGLRRSPEPITPQSRLAPSSAASPGLPPSPPLEFPSSPSPAALPHPPIRPAPTQPSSIPAESAEPLPPLPPPPSMDEGSPSSTVLRHGPAPLPATYRHSPSRARLAYSPVLAQPPTAGLTSRSTLSAAPFSPFSMYEYKGPGFVQVPYYTATIPTGRFYPMPGGNVRRTHANQ